MSFDSLAKDVSSTLSGVFGGDKLWFERSGVYALWVQAVIRKDVELIDDHGQVVTKATTVRIARNDIEITPERLDKLTEQSGDRTVYTLGKRLSDDGYSYLFEATT